MRRQGSGHAKANSPRETPESVPPSNVSDGQDMHHKTRHDHTHGQAASDDHISDASTEDQNSDGD